jgi:hypothetical protein
MMRINSATFIEGMINKSTTASNCRFTMHETFNAHLFLFII